MDITNKALQEQDEQKTLSIRQEKAILSVLQGGKIELRLKEVGVSRSTFYNWLELPHFVEAYKKARADLVYQSYRIIEHNLCRAAGVMAALLQSKTERIRLDAAKSIIDLYEKHIENEKIQQRILSLELRVK